MNKRTLAVATFTIVGFVGVAAADGPAKPGTAAGAPAMVAPMPPQKPTTPPPMAMPDDMLVKAGAAMSGTTKCKGNMMEMDGSSMPMVGTNKSVVELDKWFIHDTFTAPMGKMTMRFESYTTYDASTKTWNRLMMFNDGEWMTGSATPTDPTHQEWTMSTNGPHGAGVFRDHVDVSDPKAGVKLWGEASMDKGKTFKKVYEMVCKR
jgi:hypothetical protein